MDIRAFLDEPVSIKPMERKLIPTGLYIELPAGYEVQIRPRSGLAIRQGLTLLNSPGTIDSDYRGEINIIMINLSEEVCQIKNGDRIAQMVLSNYESAAWEEVAELAESTRGTGGFGHTGID